MKEYGLGVLEQYHIEVYSTRKTRGAVLCDTKQGLFLLKEITFSERRIPLLYKICNQLEQKGYHLIDTILPNIAGDLVSVAEDRSKYILKKWFAGRECDARKENEVQEAAKNLALLHNMTGHLVIEMNESNEEMLKFYANDIEEEYQRHSRELRKVRSFMRDRVTKGDFELLFLKHYEEMYAWAEQVKEKLNQSNYQKLSQKSIFDGSITHGDYNYHNVVMTYQGVVTTNYEQFALDVQVADLYYFLRKVMEKNKWKVSLGEEILNAYNSIRTLSHEELEYIAIRLAYPEKFWKMSNSYYYSNKAWIPAKNVEKLKITIEQNEVKRLFLKDIFSFHL